LTQLLKYDINHTPFELIATEKAIQDRIKVKTPHGEIKIKLGGYIDRVDRKDNVLRIIDYKTGSGSKLLKELDSLFDREAKNRPSHIFQTFLYASIMCRQKQEKIAPAILYLRETTRDDSPIIQMGHNKNSMVEITNFALLADQYNKRLQELLEELFDNHTAFNQTEFINRCSYCDYKQLCHRESGQ
ncbi:MAG: PD-(D/E)XK nuclease family protein, partial [Bacteroidales bacterium]|nr:PD-(D/E)XK nuclease family protein [Bacteroidales bacterium]